MRQPVSKIATAAAFLTTSACGLTVPSLENARTKAVEAAERGDFRYYAYWTNSDNFYISTPGVNVTNMSMDEIGSDKESIPLTGIRGWSLAVHLRLCSDCDDPISIAGYKRITWAAEYNRTICKLATARRRRPCTIRYDEIG